MTQQRATVPVAISREMHDVLRRIAYENRTTMRDVAEKAILYYTLPRAKDQSKEGKKVT